MPRRLGLGIVALSLWAAAGCGDSGEPAGADDQGSPAHNADVPSHGPPAYDRRFEGLVLACMVDAGFSDYRPFNPFGGDTEDGMLRLGLTEAEFIRQYGWGITTTIDLVAETGETPDNPNWSLVKTLEPGALMAFLQTESICQREALDELGPPPGQEVVSDAMLDALTEARSDPRVRAAAEDYRACMAARGFDATGGEIQEELNHRVFPIRQQYEQHLATEASGGDPGRVRLEEVLDVEQRRELAMLQHRETQAAVADLECGDLLYPVEAEVAEEYLRGVDQTEGD